MKLEIVRARIDGDLKSRATAVLQGCGLDMSDALRLFLVQVVNEGGLPFTVRQATKTTSGKRMRQIKRASQRRDHTLIAQGGTVDEIFLIRPEIVKEAQVIWPRTDL